MRAFRVGLGYRRAMHEHYFTSEGRNAIDFLELAPENYAGLGGSWRRRLEQARSEYPIITHGLALSLGGEAPLDAALIRSVAELTSALGTPWHSDHLCWSSTERVHLHELLPVPFTRASAKRIAARIREVASELPVPLAIENISTYARHTEDELDEPDFVTEVVERADCRLLLDVNNLFVNSINFGGDPARALGRMPLEATVQIHVAGHKREAPDLAIDTHGEPIIEPVYALLEHALARTGPVPVLLERDHNYPAFADLLTELERIGEIGRRLFGAEDRAGAQHV